MNTVASEFYGIFGAVFADLRYQRSLSLRQVARMSGLTAVTLNQIETGKVWPRRKSIQTLLDVLGVDHISFAREMILYLQQMDTDSSVIQGENGGVMTPP